MIELVRSSDPVLISFATSLLTESGNRAQRRGLADECDRWIDWRHPHSGHGHAGSFGRGPPSLLADAGVRIEAI